MEPNGAAKTTFNNNHLKLSHKQPLNLSELVAAVASKEECEGVSIKCLLCESEYTGVIDIKPYLVHLLRDHQLVISDVDQIGNFPK